MAEEYTSETELARLTALHRRRLIRGELRDCIAQVIIQPAAQILGPDAIGALGGLADKAADDLTDQLIGEDRLTAADASRILSALVHRGRPGWSRSPLGQAIADAGDTAPSETITAEDAARRLGVSRRHVARLIRTGKLRTSTNGLPLLAAVLDLMIER